MKRSVLHIDFISLKDRSQAQRLLSRAQFLKDLPRVTLAAGIEAEAGSDFDLAIFFVLDDYLALEPFGTDPRYARFLQGEVAPALRSFAGADVRLESEIGLIDGFAACMALSAPDEVYDWEIKQQLDAWRANLTAVASCSGLTAGERQQFRGLAMAFSPSVIEAGSRPGRPDTMYGTGRVHLI